MTIILRVDFSEMLGHVIFVSDNPYLPTFLLMLFVSYNHLYPAKKLPRLVAYRLDTEDVDDY